MAKAALFTDPFHINVARKVAAMHLIGSSSLSLDILHFLLPRGFMRPVLIASAYWRVLLIARVHI